jgi:hypothetical protein
MRRELIERAFEIETRYVGDEAKARGLWPTKAQFAALINEAGHAEVICRKHGGVTFRIWAKDYARVISIEHDEAVYPFGVGVSLEETRNNYKAADALAFLRFERGLES